MSSEQYALFRHAEVSAGFDPQRFDRVVPAIAQALYWAEIELPKQLAEDGLSKLDVEQYVAECIAEIFEYSAREGLDSPQLAMRSYENPEYRQ